ncbi:MAG: pyroglutamyl-peptidase I [Planctomycetes bacterium]|nr:pyroglutamyl-peptidase I [Planctomycetota bacterium]
MKILLTGFNPFGKVKRNPSELIVRRLRERPRAVVRADLVLEVLPTEFLSAGKRIQELIREVRPDAVVCLGVAQMRTAISLERFALNVNDCTLPDNAGARAEGRCIAEKGPEAYRSTLPLDYMREALQQRGIPVHISNHAGTYVCNHVFYTARDEVEHLDHPARCGFIHVPRLCRPGQFALWQAARKWWKALPGPGLPLSTMVQAVEICLHVVEEETVPLEGKL